LRALAAANNGFPPDPQALAHVNAELARLEVRPLLTSAGSLVWRPVETALGVLLTAVAAAFADGTWARFKACAADDCRYAFYDHTKNRSARWCDVAGCGVNARMRAYRQRRARA
jgi:predicted RNA-binding Zn ribbon-like protein